MLNSDCSTAKHGTQNIQNDCHQWLSDSFGVHQIRFRPGLHHGPRYGSLHRSPDSTSWFRGPRPTSKGRGKKREEQGRKGKDGEGPAPLRKFLDPLLSPLLARAAYCACLLEMKSKFC